MPSQKLLHVLIWYGVGMILILLQCCPLQCRKEVLWLLLCQFWSSMNPPLDHLWTLLKPVHYHFDPYFDIFSALFFKKLFENEAFLHCMHQTSFRSMLHSDGFPMLCRISQCKDILHRLSPLQTTWAFIIEWNSSLHSSIQLQVYQNLSDRQTNSRIKDEDIYSWCW